MLLLRGISPTDIEPHLPLHIEGDGFPPGQRGSLHLVGRTHRPGQAAIDVDMEIAARAVTSNSALVDLSPATLASMGGRGTFEGHAKLRFSASASSAHVAGKLKRLELVLVSAQQSDDLRDASLREQARRMLEFIGVRLDLDADGSGGMRIAHIRDRSLAAKAGLLAGDRIARASEIVVHSQADLAPIPGATDVILGVVRGNHNASIDTRISLAGFTEPVLHPMQAASAWLVVALLWFTAFYGPLRSPSLWLFSLVARFRQLQSRWTLRLWDDHAHLHATGLAHRQHVPRQRSRRNFDIAALSLAAATLLLIALVGPSTNLQFHAIPVYFGTAAVVLWVSLAVDRDAWPTRLQHAQSTFGQLIVLAISIGSACALSGTRSIDGVVNAQGFLPHRWAVFAELPQFILFPVFAMTMGKSPPRNLGFSPQSSALAYAGLLYARLLLCGMGAAIFAGGWASQELSAVGDYQARLLGALAFVTKSFGLAYLLQVVRVLSQEHKRSWFVSPALTACSLATMVLWMAHEAGTQARLFCGTVLSSAFMLIAVTIFMRAWVAGIPKSSAASYIGRNYAALSSSAAKRPF